MENTVEKKVIKISEVIECLDKSMDRTAIAAHFSISKKECVVLFQNPKLKGLKPRKKDVVSFVLEDDTEEKVESSKEEVSSTQEIPKEVKTDNPITNLYTNTEVTDKIEEEDLEATKNVVMPTEEKVKEKKPWGKVTID